MNLSTDFDGQSVEPVYLPYTASDTLLMYPELTMNPLPQNVTSDDIEKRFVLMVKHFENQRLTLSAETGTLDVGFIFGYDYWSFTGYGELSRLPLVKIGFLRELMKKFLKSDYKDVNVYYFITGLKSKPFVELFEQIEVAGFSSDSDLWTMADTPFQWIKKSDLPGKTEIKDSKYVDDSSTLTKNMEDSKNSFISSFKNKFSGIFQKAGMNDNIINNIISRSGNMLNHIKTVQQYHAANFFEISSNFLRQSFGVASNLKSNETAIRFTIDDSNGASYLLSKTAYTAFILEYIDNKYRDNILKNKYLRINEIHLQQVFIKDLLNKLKSVTANAQVYIPETEQTEIIEYKTYSIADDDLIKNYPKLDNSDEVSFVSHTDVENAIGYLYDHKKRETVRILLEKKNIQTLEKKVFEFKDEVFSTPVYEFLSHGTITGSINEIRELYRTESENKSTLKSNIEYESYLESKAQLVSRIGERRNELISHISVLPFLKHILISLILSLLLVLVLGLPLYSFLNPPNALVFGLLFMILCGFSLPFIFKSVRKKLNSIIYELKALHKQLFDHLTALTDEILRTAKDTRNTIIKRKNLEELHEKILEYELKQLKMKRYHSFLTILDQSINNICQVCSIPDEEHHPSVSISSFEKPPYLNPVFKFEKTGQKGLISVKLPNSEAFDLETPDYSLIRKIEFAE